MLEIRDGTFRKMMRTDIKKRWLKEAEIIQPCEVGNFLRKILPNRTDKTIQLWGMARGRETD